MEHRRLLTMTDDAYRVEIDSELADGSLTYGEYVHHGRTDREVLFSAHICHPSLANDNCSGLAMLTLLAARLKGRQTRYGYRFVFAPGTIGSLAFLAANEALTERIDHGLVVSCVGDGGGPDLQEEPARRRDDRPGDGADHARRRPRCKDRRVLALRL